MMTAISIAAVLDCIASSPAHRPGPTGSVCAWFEHLLAWKVKVSIGYLGAPMTMAERQQEIINPLSFA